LFSSVDVTLFRLHQISPSTSTQRLDKSSEDLSDSKQSLNDTDTRAQSTSMLNDSTDMLASNNTLSVNEDDDEDADEDYGDEPLRVNTGTGKVADDGKSAETASAVSTADDSGASAAATPASGDWLNYLAGVRKASAVGAAKLGIPGYDTVPLASGDGGSLPSPRGHRRRRHGDPLQDSDGDELEEEGDPVTGEDDYDYEYISEGEEGRLSAGGLTAEDASSMYGKEGRSADDGDRTGLMASDADSILGGGGASSEGGGGYSSGGQTETLRVVKVYFNNVREYKTQFLKPSTTVEQILANLTKTMNMPADQKSKYELFEMTETEGTRRVFV
jgi:hypothetical protein